MPFEKGNAPKQGRPQRSQNVIRREILANIERNMRATRQITPLEFCLRVLNGPDFERNVETGNVSGFTMKEKQWAAQTAMPYIHKRKPFAIEGGDARKPIHIATEQQLGKLSDNDLAQLMRICGTFSHELLEMMEQEEQGSVIDGETGNVIDMPVPVRFKRKTKPKLER